MHLRAKIAKRKYENPDEDFDEFENSIVVNEVETGDSFGEIALRHKVPRTCSIRSINESYFAVLSYESYHKIIKMYHDYLIRKEIKDLKKFAVFESMPIQTLENLFKYMI